MRNIAMEEDGGVVSRSTAVMACTAMALLYVAVLYAPTLILRLPPPNSFRVFMIRRFICALVSSLVSVVVCALLLPISSMELLNLFDAFGIRADHIWQAVIFPLSLTSLMYAGSFALKSLLLLESWREDVNHSRGFSLNSLKNLWKRFFGWFLSTASNVMAWRNYVVAPLTEELVFRACMIPLLLCVGFKTTTVILLCPIFFSLAHLNHMIEYYNEQNNSLIGAFMVVGLQLGYTLVFGSYATFLFVRTGHFLAPLIAHVFCNFMGLPVLLSRSKGFVCVAFVAGTVGFSWLLFPITSPDLYNERTNNCRSWHGYCSWS